jgi:hypothetical protein
VFFLLLIQFGRAGTESLRQLFNEQIDALAKSQNVLKNRLEYKKILSLEDQATFYSSWHYGAIHVLVSVPGCHNEKGISEYLGIPLQKTTEVLNFLVTTGLVERADGKYKIGTSHIHLGIDSPMLARHHSNWRMQAIQDLDREQRETLHYSSVISCSREDSAKMRSILVKAIEDVRALVKGSKDEDGFCYAVDFFGLKRR